MTNTGKMRSEFYKDLDHKLGEHVLSVFAKPEEVRVAATMAVRQTVFDLGAGPGTLADLRTLAEEYAAVALKDDDCRVRACLFAVAMVMLDEIDALTTQRARAAA
jgi:hypothetical protein